MLQQMPPPFAWSRVEHDARGCRLSRGVSQGAQTTPKHRTCRHFMHSRATCCDSEKQTLRSYGSEGFWFNSKWVRQSRPRTNGSPFLKSHEGSPIEQDSAMPSLVPRSSPLWTKAAQKPSGIEFRNCGRELAAECSAVRSLEMRDRRFTLPCS